MQVNFVGGVRVPFRRLKFDPVANRNCVAARRGGEHRKVKDRSVTKVNSIRPFVVASLLDNGEAQLTRHVPGGTGSGLPITLAVGPGINRNHIMVGNDNGWLETE